MKYKVFAILLFSLLLVSCGRTAPAETEKPPMYPLADEPITLVTEPQQSPSPVSGDQTPPKDLPAAKTVISFAAAGDNIAHDSVVATAKAAATGGKTYDFSQIYADIKPLISKVDLAFVNQEAPVGGASLGISGYPNFNAPQ